MKTNVLYYGDNLEVLRKKEWFPDESVDLVYLDPPFKSQQDYNLLFKTQKGTPATAQVQAFTDTWEWGPEAKAAYEWLVSDPLVPGRVAEMIQAFYKFLDGAEMMAYLVMMTPRLLELHRVLKPTGSLYLHCDPAASHYLKIALDTIFGPENFRNEIVWRRTGVHSDARRFARVSDRLLFYSKRAEFLWNPVKHHGEKHAKDVHYKYEDERGRYRLDNLNPPGGRGPAYEFHGFSRPWRFTRENMLKLEAQGLIVASPDKVPQLKRYFKPEIPVPEIWDDVSPINSQAKERLPYPTQKPLALLERIIQASSNPGNLVLDPFCGCGTAVVAAEELGRKWIGIDITYLAIDVMARRLRDHFPGIKFEVEGHPKDVEGAKALAQKNRFQFQVWALSLIGAQAVVPDKKGPDRGIDGYLPFRAGKEVERAIVQVKSGGVGVKDIRDLHGTMQREKANCGLLITLEPPTPAMRKEAVDAGTYQPLGAGVPVPRIEILTIEDMLLKEKRPALAPYSPGPVPHAPRLRRRAGHQPALGGGAS